MRYLNMLLIICGIAITAPIVSCNKAKTTTTTGITAIGMLQKQGFTTYMYGTHVLLINGSVAYVLKSTTIDLDPYVGRTVKITAIDANYHAENGHEEYDVTAIALQ